MKNILLSLAILIGLNTNAQEVKIKWAKNEYKSVSLMWGLQYLGWKGDKFYKVHKDRLNNNKYIYYLETIKPNLERDDLKKLSEKTYVGAFSTIIGDHIYGIQIQNDGVKTDKGIIYYNKYDMQGEFIESNEILVIDDLSKFTQMYTNFDVSKSDDGKTLGMSFTNIRKKEKVARWYNIIMDINDFSNHKVFFTDLPFENKVPRHFKFPSLRVTNNGGIVAIIKHYDDLGSEDEAELSIRVMDASGEFKAPLELKHDQKVLKRISFKSYDDYVMLYGEYCDDPENTDEINGFYLGKLDIETNAIQNMNFFPYESEFFKKLGYEVEDNVIDGNLNQYLRATSDGGGYLIQSHTVNKSGNIYSNELIIMPFDKNAKVSGRFVFPKKFFGEGFSKKGAGSISITRGNELIVIYNDQKSHINVSDFTEMKHPEKWNKEKVATYISTVKKDGSISKKILFNASQKSGLFNPGGSISSEDKVILNMTEKLKQKYGLLTFE